MPLLTVVLTSALFAGLVAVGATVAVERLGGRVGGVLATTPSTILAAAAGVYAAAPTEAAFQAAMSATPAGMLLNALFLWLWRLVPPHLPARGLGARLVMMTTLSLGAWLLGAFGVVTVLGPIRAAGDTASLLWIGLGLTVAAILLGLITSRGVAPSASAPRPVPLGVLIARGLFAAIAVSVAVVWSRLGGPLAAGMASVFPVIFLTTMVSLWLSQGEAVQSGAVGPMMLGSTAVSAFALIAAFALPAFGVVLGCVVSWFGAVLLVSLPAAAWVRRGR
ncbi:hypothetical protein L6R49_04865 [Myxococcota bacterium]|nr:hypothetical protein [Myxococcota bacterium]